MWEQIIVSSKLHRINKSSTSVITKCFIKQALWHGIITIQSLLVRTEHPAHLHLHATRTSPPPPTHATRTSPPPQTQTPRKPPNQPLHLLHNLSAVSSLINKKLSERSKPNLAWRSLMKTIRQCACNNKLRFQSNCWLFLKSSASTKEFQTKWSFCFENSLENQTNEKFKSNFLNKYKLYIIFFSFFVFNYIY